MTVRHEKRLPTANGHARAGPAWLSHLEVNAQLPLICGLPERDVLPPLAHRHPIH
jgi:hypothetical protein